MIYYNNFCKEQLLKEVFREFFSILCMFVLKYFAFIESVLNNTILAFTLFFIEPVLYVFKHYTCEPKFWFAL